MEQGTTAAMPVANNTKQKSGAGLKIFAVIACLLAVGGIGFGAFGMIQAGQKDKQISDLKVQVKNDDGTTTTIETPKIETKDDKTTVTITDSVAQAKNPMITNPDYRVVYQTAGRENVLLYANNGTLTNCYVQTSTFDDCTISGITGKISKISEAGEGQDSSDAKIIFIMEDGSGEYVSLWEMIENKTATAKKANISGFVTDTINIDVTDGMSGYASTLFVLSDDSTVKYNNSMFN